MHTCAFAPSVKYVFTTCLFMFVHATNNGVIPMGVGVDKVQVRA
jgi:hypothetical protein